MESLFEFEFVSMQWLEAHPTYFENPLYIGGESYSGIIVPMIVQQLLDGIYILLLFITHSPTIHFPY